jgi:hypothetical protein
MADASEQAAVAGTEAVIVSKSAAPAAIEEVATPPEVEELIQNGKHSPPSCSHWFPRLSVVVGKVGGGEREAARVPFDNNAHALVLFLFGAQRTALGAVYPPHHHRATVTSLSRSSHLLFGFLRWLTSALCARVRVHVSGHWCRSTSCD